MLDSPNSSAPVLKMINIHKRFLQHEVLCGVSLEVQKSEVLAIIGPSGSGKSTLIRAVNHLESVDSGSIHIQGNVGMVFQSFNLFSHLNILQNMVLAPIKVLRWDRDKSTDLAMALLKRVGIEKHVHKYPHELSGGQQQRAAIARALMMQPNLLLFDEPTSSLDPEMTAEVLDVIRGLAHSISMVIVTHEMGFARQVADRVVFLDHGHILEEGPAKNFFENPKAQRVKEFLGRTLKY